MLPETLYSLATRWFDSPLQLTFIRKSANQVYRVNTSEEEYYLRITKHWDQNALESALDFHLWLYNHKLPICQPLASKSGNWVETIEWEGSNWFVRMVKSVPGKPLNTELKDVEVYRLWGEAVANLHLVAEEYQPPQDSYFLSWEEEWETVIKARKWFVGKEIEEYELLSDWKNSRMMELPGGQGVVHADCNASNFLFDGKTLFTIDIDEPMQHFYLSDIARPFRELVHLPKNEYNKYQEAFTNAYLAIRPIEGFQVSDLLWLSKMKSLEAYVWAIELDEKAREEDWIKYIFDDFGKDV